MNIFKNFNRKKPGQQKTQYLGGWEVNLDGEPDCNRFIETQLTTAKVAESMPAHIALKYDNNGDLTSAICYDEDGSSADLTFEKGKVKYRNMRINWLYDFIKNREGRSYLGGPIPKLFEIPENECPGSFQYLGMLNKSSEAFLWLPFNVHLIAPIFMDMDKVWLDYSNPNAPQIINMDEVNDLSTAYEELQNDSFIEFEKVRFDTIKTNEITIFSLGSAGIPTWIQNPDIPICPKTKKTMRFLCTIESSDQVNTSKTNIIPQDEWHGAYFENMNFWASGNLYVFFEPDSKTACYLIQST